MHTKKPRIKRCGAFLSWAESCPFGRSEQHFLTPFLALARSFAAALPQPKRGGLGAVLGDR